MLSVWFDQLHSFFLAHLGYAPTPGVGTLRFDTSADYGGNWTTRWARQGNQTSNKFESSTADSDGGTTGWLHAKVSLHYDGAPAMSVRAGSRSGAGVVPPGSDSGELVEIGDVAGHRHHEVHHGTPGLLGCRRAAGNCATFLLDRCAVWSSVPFHPAC